MALKLFAVLLWPVASPFFDCKVPQGKIYIITSLWCSFACKSRGLFFLLLDQ